MKSIIYKLLLFFYKFISFLIKLFIIVFLLIVLLLSSYALYDSYQIHKDVKIDNSLERIIENDNPIHKLNMVNKNIVGWIKINKTSINYPILKGKDNLEYLNKNYKDEYSFAGSIFLDYRNNNFKDKYSIIYGHNLYRGGMFSDIKKYKDKSFFNKHKFGKLFTKDYTYDIKVISYGIFKNNDEFVYNISSYNIDYIINKSIIKKETKSDKYVLLSTCYSSSSKERIILLCELKKSL